MSLEHIFFFNDCIPEVDNKIIFVEKLCLTIIEFNKLLNKEINVARGIVTHQQPSLCNYGNSYNLNECLSLIQDKSVRDLAYSLFLRFPIGQPHYDDDFEEFLVESYETVVQEKILDALNLAIVQKNNGFVFSLAVCDELRKDFIKMSICQKDKAPLDVPNLYGDNNNTKIIEGIIVKRNQDLLEIFQQFLVLFDVPVYSNQFKKEFDSLSENSKKLIIEHFKNAKVRGLQTNFSPDGELIKDVSPTKKKCNVSELRVFKDKALRVYFNESNKGVFFASIGFKNNNQQDQDIKQAHNIIYKLILTN